MRSDKKEKLKIARSHIFSTGINDTTSALCKANMQYGVAKLHAMQEQCSMQRDAFFISSPDETITRNRHRWTNGFGYGGKIVWGNSKEKVINLDVMPNACGMLVGGVDELPQVGELIERVHELMVNDVEIEGIKMTWDFGKGNHFIDLFRIESALKLPEYAFIIHAGAPEVKCDNARGFGLYRHKSKELARVAECVHTMFGNTWVVTDSNAKAYLDFYKFADKFAKKRREAAAKHIFGKFNLISNTTHQGLLNYNEILLGSSLTTDPSLLPVAFRADLPACLVEGKENLSPELIESLGFKGRAEKLGLADRLTHANICPHGGGYTDTNTSSVVDVIEVNSSRYFIMNLRRGMGRKIIEDPRGVEFAYRGREILMRSLELGLAKVAARLVPNFVLKI